VLGAIARQGSSRNERVQAAERVLTPLLLASVEPELVRERPQERRRGRAEAR
jgi:hypothetical protein